MRISDGKGGSAAGYYVRNIQLDGQGLRSIMTIRQVNSKDLTNFRCKASNSLGFSRAVIAIETKDKKRYIFNSNRHTTIKSICEWISYFLIEKSLSILVPLLVVSVDLFVGLGILFSRSLGSILNDRRKDRNTTLVGDCDKLSRSTLKQSFSKTKKETI